MNNRLRISLIIAIFATITSIIACQSKKESVLVELSGKTFGTYYSISYYDLNGKDYQTGIDSVLQLLDNSLSIYNPNSLISAVNEADTSFIPTDAYFQTVIEASKEISAKTGGAFDVTVGPLVNAWGFGFKHKEKIEKQLIDSLLQLVGMENLKIENRKIKKLKKDVTLDFNAIAKGYGVDVVADYLSAMGVNSMIVEIGGEVVCKGIKPNGTYWKVGIEQPADSASAEQKLEAIVPIENMAVATSGNYRNYYVENGVKYAHTINPVTGYPVQHSLLSSTVFAKNCMTADAYATAFMVLGLEKSIAILEKDSTIDGYFIYSDSLGNIDTYATPKIKTKIEEVK